VSTALVLGVSGLGLGALYFLVASGLSLIFGLEDVLNFAHGAFLSVGAYAAWWASRHLTALGDPFRFALAVLFGLAVGAAVAGLVELLLIRRLYGRNLQQVLVTVGLALALTALIEGGWGTDARAFWVPRALGGTATVLGAHLAISGLVAVGAALALLVALELFLHLTRYGTVVRAGVEDREMVAALGIDVRRAFTVVFSLGGAAAALGGALTGVYYGSIDPSQGPSLLIFAFIVVVIGGLGSVAGSALAAVAVGLLQQFVNYYAAPGLGDLTVMLLLAVVLLVRPAGLGIAT
jgi:branched-chain amino acid transport system permease protein